MEKFIVSARKYRPATFDTVVGQASITTTLKNAIKNNHLAQAFLFCGPRGVGKTTCARILAKTINCQNLTANTEACDACDSCLSFNNSQSLNIYELDAASNNSVDDIRSLVEQVRFAPHMGSYKVYIIDEVHMLSSNAFNAFLKTLEEPPPYAIFILATTEKHKIIPTILSRCQIFDFNRIRVDDIANLLAEIAVKEEVVAEAEALHVIAQKADGALRDALSMFDQIVSFAGKEVTYAHAIENLNILDYDYYFKVGESILNGDYATQLMLFEDILAHGFDAHNFINGLSKHFRDVLICRDEVTLSLLEVGAGIKEKYKQQSKQFDPGLLIRLLEIANDCDIKYKSAKNQRLHVELALIKMCSILKVGTEINQPMIQQVAKPVPVSNSGVADNKGAAPLQSQAVNTPPVPVQDAPEKLGAVAVPRPTPATSPSNLHAGGTTISIKNFLGKKEEKKSEEQDETEGAEAKPFTDEAFSEVWNTYANMLKDEGKLVLSTAMLREKPTVSSDFKIHFVVENSFLETEFKRIMSEMMGFIKNALLNRTIQLEFEVLKDDSDERHRKYTSNEKYQHMADKNPVLNDLKNQLGLQID